MLGTSQIKGSDSRTLTDITNTPKALNDNQPIFPRKPSPANQQVLDTPSVRYDEDDDDSFLWEIDSDEEEISVNIVTRTPPTRNNNEKVSRRRGTVRLSCLRFFFPLLSTVVLVSTICPILALPAVFVEYVIYPKKTRPDPDPDEEQRLDVVMISLWMSCVWATAVVVHYFVNVVPELVVRASVLLTGGCSEKIKSRLESYVAIRQYLKALIVASWAVGSFVFAYYLRTDADGVAYLVQMPEDRKSFTGFQIVYRVLLSLFIGCVLLLVQKYALQKIAINFHYTAYNDRILENKYSLKVLDKLRISKPRLPPSFFGQQLKTITRNTNVVETSNDRKGEADTTEKIRTDRHVDMEDTSRRKVETKQRKVAAKVAKEIRENLRSMFQISGSSEENDAHHVSSTREARKLARSLFGNLNDGRRYLIAKDMEPYFQSKSEAVKAFEMFDEDGNGDISAKEMKMKVEKIYKERRDIQQSLRDLSQVVGKLDNIMLCAVAVIFTYMVVSVAGGEVAKTLVPLSSMVLAMSFLFGNSAKNLFECIIFLFVSHPYDTGDRIFLDEQNLVVQEIGLLTTTFQQADGQLIYIPNATLATKFIRNIRRTPSQAEGINVAIAFAVPAETIDALHSRMREFVASESRDYNPALNMYVNALENVNKVHLTFWVEYKGNWQIGSRRWARRTKFVMACKQAIMDLGISIDLPLQRVHYTSANCSF